MNYSALEIAVKDALRVVPSADNTQARWLRNELSGLADMMREIRQAQKTMRRRLVSNTKAMLASKEDWNALHAMARAQTKLARQLLRKRMLMVQRMDKILGKKSKFPEEAYKKLGVRIPRT